mmetsp:Transcript_61511/g.109643  ORF Transcript_61511/g.109643 Transcript_61511/m.109643 type:complete len:263 (+) Transcript_61511:130-918(+)
MHHIVCAPCKEAQRVQCHLKFRADANEDAGHSLHRDVCIILILVVLPSELDSDKIWCGVVSLRLLPTPTTIDEATVIHSSCLLFKGKFDPVMETRDGPLLLLAAEHVFESAAVLPPLAPVHIKPEGIQYPLECGLRAPHLTFGSQVLPGILHWGGGQDCIQERMDLPHLLVAGPLLNTRVCFVVVQQGLQCPERRYLEQALINEAEERVCCGVLGGSCSDTSLEIQRKMLSEVKAATIQVPKPLAGQAQVCKLHVRGTKVLR